MNRVQTATQKHYRVKNPGQKPNWLHEPPTGPTSAPSAPRRARASVSWPAQRRIVAGLPDRIAASGCCVAGPNGRVAASCRAPPHAQPRLPARPARAPSALRARLHACACRPRTPNARSPSAPSPSAQCPARLTPSAHACLAHCHNTKFCIAAQKSANPSPSVTIQAVYCDTLYA